MPLRHLPQTAICAVAFLIGLCQLEAAELDGRELQHLNWQAFGCQRNGSRSADRVGVQDALSGPEWVTNEPASAWFGAETFRGKEPGPRSTTFGMSRQDGNLSPRFLWLDSAFEAGAAGLYAA